MAHEGRLRDHPRMHSGGSGLGQSSHLQDFPPASIHGDTRKHPQPLQQHPPPHFSDPYDRGHRPPPRPRSPSPHRRSSWDRRDSAPPNRPLSPSLYHPADQTSRSHKLEEIHRNVWDDVRSPAAFDYGPPNPSSRIPPSRPLPREEWERNAPNSPSRSSHQWTPLDPWDPRDSRRVAPLAPPPHDWERRRTTSWDDSRGPPRDLPLPSPRTLSHRPWDPESRDPPRPTASADGRWGRAGDSHGGRPMLAEPMGFRPPPPPPQPHRYTDRSEGRYPPSPNTPSNYSNGLGGSAAPPQARDYGELRRAPPADDFRPLSRTPSMAATRTIGDFLNTEQDRSHNRRPSGGSIGSPRIKREPVDDAADWKSMHPRHSTNPAAASSTPQPILPGGLRSSSRSEYPSPRVEHLNGSDYRPQSQGSTPHRHILPPISSAPSPRLYPQQSNGYSPLQSPRLPSMTRAGPPSPAVPHRMPAPSAPSPRYPPFSHHDLDRSRLPDVSVPPSRASHRSNENPIPHSRASRTPPPYHAPPSQYQNEGMPASRDSPVATHSQSRTSTHGRPTAIDIPSLPDNYLDTNHQSLTDRVIAPSEPPPAAPQTAMDIDEVDTEGQDAESLHQAPEAAPEPQGQKPQSSSTASDDTMEVDGILNDKEDVAPSNSYLGLDIDSGVVTPSEDVPVKKPAQSRPKKTRERLPAPPTPLSPSPSGVETSRTLEDALRDSMRKRSAPVDGFDVIEDILSRNQAMQDAPSTRKPTLSEHVVEDVITSRDVKDRLQYYYYNIRLELDAEMSDRHIDAVDQAEKLRETYRALNKKWIAFCQDLDQKAAADKAVATVPSTPADPVPPPLPASAAPSGRATRRTAGNLGIMADAVRSDLEFEQVMATLGNEDLVDPNVLSIRNAAVIPDMHSVVAESAYQMDVIYDDTNGVVDYPEQFYNVSVALGHWSEKEKEIFVEQFATYGKQFGKVAEKLPDKTTEQCVLFYYIQKRTAVNFRDVASRGTRGRRRRGFAKRQSTIMSGKQKGNALLTDIRTRMDDDAADSPSGSPKPSDVELPVIGPTRRRRNAGSSTPITNEEPAKTRSGRTSTRLRRELSPSTRGSDSGEDNTPARESGGESDGDDDENEPLGPEEPRRGKPRRARKPTQAADGSVNVVPPSRRRAPGTTSYWTTQEKAIFMEQLGIVGKNFAAIANVVGTKSATQCRNYFQNNSKDKDLKLPEIAAGADAKMKEGGQGPQPDDRGKEKDASVTAFRAEVFDERARQQEQPQNGTWPYGPRASLDFPNSHLIPAAAFYGTSNARPMPAQEIPSGMEPSRGVPYPHPHPELFHWHTDERPHDPNTTTSRPPTRGSATETATDHGDHRLQAHETNGRYPNVHPSQLPQRGYYDPSGGYDRNRTTVGHETVPSADHPYAHYSQGPPPGRSPSARAPAPEMHDGPYSRPPNHPHSVHHGAPPPQRAGTPPHRSAYPSTSSSPRPHSNYSPVYHPTHYHHPPNNYTSDVHLPPFGSKHASQPQQELPPFGTKHPVAPMQNDGGNAQANAPPAGSRLRDLPFYKGAKTSTGQSSSSPLHASGPPPSPMTLPPFGSKVPGIHGSPTRNPWPHAQRTE